MTRTALLTAILSLATTSAFAADSTASGTFERTLTVSAAPAVTISTGSGYIHVYPGPGTQVHITGHVRAGRSHFYSDAQARVQQVLASPPITQSGNIVTVGNDHADSDLYRNIAIDYDLTLPSATTMKVHSGSGSIEIGGIEGSVNAGTGSGNIHVDNIGARAVLETGSGFIHATNVHGAASLETGSGNIELAVTAAGDVKAQTGSGSIHLSGVEGALRADSGSGSIEANGNPTSEWRLQSGSGSIHLQLPASAHFVLNAETGSGGIHLDRPIVMQGSLNKNHVSGTVNGGGPTLRATTGSGSITIN